MVNNKLFPAFNILFGDVNHEQNVPALNISFKGRQLGTVYILGNQPHGQRTKPGTTRGDCSQQCRTTQRQPGDRECHNQ